MNRLKEHHASPRQGLEDWYEAVAFTTLNNIFGATEISWLENRFFSLAVNTNRYEAKNGNELNAGNVTEEKESELEEYVEYAKIVMGVLGHLVFESLVQNRTPHNTEHKEDDDNLEFFMEQKMQNAGMTVKAKCKRSSEGYIVLRGSVINSITNEKSCSGVAKKAREKAKVDENYMLLEDVLFSSPSAASMFVTADDEVKMFLFGGGGGAAEVFPYIDFENIRKHPKLFSSYSDGTSILNAVHAQTGLVTYYGQGPGEFAELRKYAWEQFKFYFMGDGLGLFY